MKRILLILITIILVLHICPLSSLANSNDYSFMDGVTSEKNPETFIMKNISNSRFKEFNEKYDVKLDKEWTIKFSGEVTKEKIEKISVNKNAFLIPIDFKITGINQVKIKPLSGYEADTRYCLQIILKNGNRYMMYFNTISSSSTGELETELEILRLVNIERNKEGLSSLKLGDTLTQVATLKSQDMADNNYFNHISPTYGTPWEMMKQFGIKYTLAGENIAYGYGSPEAVMIGWMNSPGHRSNILNPRFGTLGVGFVVGNGRPYWTQMFTN